uniref:AXH domain-containing protein n=3 Tax=Denticeps clupeoides TaxID=299321 RepID=A0AAY4E7A6_9TELE
MSASPSPVNDSLPPKKRATRQCSSEEPLVHVFKVPASYMYPKGVRRLQEPKDKSLFTPPTTFYHLTDKPYSGSFINTCFPTSSWMEQCSSNGQVVHPISWITKRTDPHVNYPSAVPSRTFNHRFWDLQIHSDHLHPKPWTPILSTPYNQADFFPDVSSRVHSRDRWLDPAVKTNSLYYRQARHRSQKNSSWWTAGGNSRTVLFKSPSARTMSSLSDEIQYTTSTSAKHVLNTTFAGLKQPLLSNPVCPESEQSNQGSTPNASQFPLLDRRCEAASSFSLPPRILHHFAIGSLIELSGGRCKRVEELQMEDFLLCADAYPEFCLRSCTVQHISTSRAPELTRLHILLDNSHTQDFLDVFVEFPFFVCGRGWSSCCPQRTSQMCGLSCHQLFVGDVCLVLTPSPVISPAPRQCG